MSSSRVASPDLSATESNCPGKRPLNYPALFLIAIILRVSQGQRAALFLKEEARGYTTTPCYGRPIDQNHRWIR